MDIIPELDLLIEFTHMWSIREAEVLFTLEGLVIKDLKWNMCNRFVKEKHGVLLKYFNKY